MEPSPRPNKTRRWALVSIGLMALLATIFVALWWSPGVEIRDGRHDLGRNAIWIGHGWMGDDGWFERYNKDTSLFRTDDAVGRLSKRLRDHHILDVYPHLCPTNTKGDISPLDPAQTARLLNDFEGLRVIPWVGGARARQAFIEEPDWRARFAASIADMLTDHPRLAGVHINIEPVEDGNKDFLTVLDDVRAALPPGRILSVSAHPPPQTLPMPSIAWSLDYYAQVAARADQIAVMAYNTGLPEARLYTAQVARWTTDILAATPDTDILIGLPTYGDEGQYHHEAVENIETALVGVHAALDGGPIPSNFQGVALYSAWEMDAIDWQRFKTHFTDAPKETP